MFKSYLTSGTWCSWMRLWIPGEDKASCTGNKWCGRDVIVISRMRILVLYRRCRCSTLYRACCIACMIVTTVWTLCSMLPIPSMPGALAMLVWAFWHTHVRTPAYRYIFNIMISSTIQAIKFWHPCPQPSWVCYYNTTRYWYRRKTRQPALASNLRQGERERDSERSILHPCPGMTQISGKMHRTCKMQQVYYS